MNPEATPAWWRWAARQWAGWTAQERDDLAARAAELMSYGATVEQAERTAFLEHRERRGDQIRRAA